MSTVTPSTCVTCRHASDPNNVPCDIVGRATCNSQMPGLHMHRWFSGRIPASHAGDPGSIPGRCRLYFHTYTL